MTTLHLMRAGRRIHTTETVTWIDSRSEILADYAVRAMISEADLTPKPGLVDQRGSGAHADLTLDLMHRSARSLRPCFEAMADIAADASPGQSLREQLAAIGRDGERAMFRATGGANTHKGAIWALGLLVAAAAMTDDHNDASAIARSAASIAHYPDPRAPEMVTNGSRVANRYGVPGARGEARDGFPHVIGLGLPTLYAMRARGAEEEHARLDALLSIMASLDDTCLLHRGGRDLLDIAKDGARNVLVQGGAASGAGRLELRRLDRSLLDRNGSPGGSGDLLAATLFLDSLITSGAGSPVPAETQGYAPSWKY